MSIGMNSYKRYTSYDGYKDCYVNAPKRILPGNTAPHEKYGMPDRPFFAMTTKLPGGFGRN